MWVWCPLTSGCSTGNGTFPYLGCQLKAQANLSSGAQPDAWERGPPTAFVSGVFLGCRPHAASCMHS